MKIAVVSDIHGNVVALEAVLKSIKTQGIDSIYCLGDIVGYGADPNDCVSIIRSQSIPSALGNHDAAAVFLEQSKRFNSKARTAIEWTFNTLTPDNKAFLSQLPYTIEKEDTLFVHATPIDPESWTYLYVDHPLSPVFNHLKPRVIFIGHTHVPGISASTKIIVNAGSVGQPRDGNPDACWVAWDDVRNEATFHRVQYDVELAAQRIWNAGLPTRFGERLFSGS